MVIFYGPEEAPGVPELPQGSPRLPTRVGGTPTPLGRAPLPRGAPVAPSTYPLHPYILSYPKTSKTEIRSEVPPAASLCSHEKPIGALSGPLPEGASITGGHGGVSRRGLHHHEGQGP